jgi:hypothetical protein
VLIRELGVQVATPLFDAATDLADPALCGPLAVAAQIGQPWPNYFRTHWISAIAVCGCEKPA